MMEKYRKSKSHSKDGGMKEYRFWKLLMIKKWFDTGLGLTNYLKYPLVLFGIAEITLFRSYKIILIASVLYTIICFILGWAWLKYGFFLTKQEISNIFNLFVKEMRERKNI